MRTTGNGPGTTEVGDIAENVRIFEEPNTKRIDLARKRSHNAYFFLHFCSAKNELRRSAHKRHKHSFTIFRKFGSMRKVDADRRYLPMIAKPMLQN